MKLLVMGCGGIGGIVTAAQRPTAAYDRTFQHRVEQSRQRVGAHVVRLQHRERTRQFGQPLRKRLTLLARPQTRRP